MELAIGTWCICADIIAAISDFVPMNQVVDVDVGLSWKDGHFRAIVSLFALYDSPCTVFSALRACICLCRKYMGEPVWNLNAC